MEFPRLPVELLEEIVGYLEPLEILAARQLSRQFRSLVDESTALQLRIEAYADGYILQRSSTRSSGGITAKELLDALRGMRKRSRRLVPRQILRYGCPFNDELAFEICDSTWGHTLRAPTRSFRALNYIHLAPLPSQGKDVHCFPEPLPLPRPGIDHSNLSVEIIDFTFMVGCDLQVLLESIEDGHARLHFRSISSDQPHPLAARPIIDVPDRTTQEHRGCDMLLYESRIALTYLRWTRHAGELGGVSVWDWKTGENLLDYRPAIDAAFLPHDQMLLLYDADAEGPARFSVYSFREGSVTHVLQLPLDRPISFGILLTHPSNHYGSNAPTSVNKLLKTDPETDIILMELRLTAPDSGLFRVAISIGRLLKACIPKTEYELEQDEPGTPKVLRWRHWGINATRWFTPYSLMRTSVRSTYGSRFLAFGRPNSFQGDDTSLQYPWSRDDWPTLQGGRILLFDFNPRAIRRDMGGNSIHGDQSFVYTEPTLWDSDRPHTRKVLSALPFRVTTSPKNWDYHHIYMNGSTLFARRDHYYDVFSFLPWREGDLELQMDKHPLRPANVI
ncbi:SubName: Full=Uncharacterized protein {ECO:0000313/EMBL:CCA68072.1} [Serendipita indica DSM 11827]|nr:SubName: Full=Uncharacterized protein {ECO:0000313/EMBL:CCA68072.1} [Serendipita indica DSM 11827]